MFGAVCPETGETNGWLMPFANTETMNIQLSDFSRQLGPDVHAILVLDQAGWHTTKRLTAPENVTPYSPELNPVELLWRYLRQLYLSDRVYRDRESLEEAAAIAWRRLTDNPEAIISICGFDRISEGTN
jgi:transposase